MEEHHMNDELILLRFVEIERNIRNIQEDIDEISRIRGSLDTEIDTINNKLKLHSEKFNRLESRLYDIGRLFRDTFASSSFSKSR